MRAQKRGFQAFVVPVRRQDWLRVARGMLSRDYWAARALPAVSYGWYLRLVQATVHQARRESGADQAWLGCRLRTARVRLPAVAHACLLPAGDPRGALCRRLARPGFCGRPAVL